jgi:hypothetical protein
MSSTWRKVGHTSLAQVESATLPLVVSMVEPRADEAPPWRTAFTGRLARSPFDWAQDERKGRSCLWFREPSC